MATKRMVAGERLKLSDYTTSRHLDIHIQIESTMTVDICCFGLDAGRALSDDRYLIFYNQLSSPENAVSLTANGPTKAVFSVRTDKLPASIKTLVFTATIDGNGTMSAIASGHLAVFDGARETLGFGFSGQDFQNERAIMIGEIYLKEEWRLGAVGQGFNGGLSALLKHFGGEEKVSPMPSNGYRHYYGKLDAPMKAAYDALLEGVTHFSDNIHLNANATIQEASVRDLFQYVTLDNPSIFYLASGFQYSIEGNAIWLRPQYLFDPATIRSMADRLADAVETILKTVIRPAMDDYGKELALHDYLVKNVAYDLASLSMPNPPKDIYTAYGALIGHKAVCSGYAHAMKMLLDNCGIDCLVVAGDSVRPGGDASVGHAWNIVKIKGQFYHLDVTWDAPVNKAPGEVFHDYFNVTGQAIAIDHTWDFDVPVCKATSHNYHIYQNLAIADKGALKEMLRQVFRNKTATLSFKYVGGNPADMDGDRLNALIEDTWRGKGLFSTNFGSAALSWRLSSNDRQQVFRIVFNYG